MLTNTLICSDNRHAYTQAQSSHETEYPYPKASSQLVNKEIPQQDDKYHNIMTISKITVKVFMKLT